MKYLFFFLFFTPTFLHAEETLKKAIQIYRTDSEVDTSLQEDQAIYEFHFQSDYGAVADIEVLYSIDGENGKQLLEKGKLKIQTTPGEHMFRFYYNSAYYEVTTRTLEIKARYRDTYQVTLYEALIYEQVEKPVIYFYPEKATNVRVKMDIHGEDIFMYPTYSDAWEFNAQPSGELIFGDKIYNYLFWEASTRQVLSPKQTENGFFVEGENAVEFLEEKLSLAGLNTKEQADFITYWRPRLAKNNLNFVHFEFNEECEKYAEIDITPKPDHIYRIYMVWGAVSEEFEVKEQQIEAMDRSGFSVLEWGGQESPIKQSFVNQHTN